MTFILSILLTCLLLSIGHSFIKKHATLCCILAALISIVLVIGTHTGIIYTLPIEFTSWVLPLFTRSTLATSLFVIVMYTGILKNGSPLIKVLMPIRGTLAIIASLLTLAHNIIYGKIYFVQLFTHPLSMDSNIFFAAIVSLILILIMLPLMITSFPVIRKKMNSKTWKSIQRLSYIFYGLLYVHILLIMMPLARSGDQSYRFNILVYSAAFLTYAVIRLYNACVKSNLSPFIRCSPLIATLCLFYMIIGLSLYRTSTDILHTQDIEAVIQNTRPLDENPLITQVNTSEILLSATLESLSTEEEKESLPEVETPETSTLAPTISEPISTEVTDFAPEVNQPESLLPPDSNKNSAFVNDQPSRVDESTHSSSSNPTAFPTPKVEAPLEIDIEVSHSLQPEVQEPFSPALDTLIENTSSTSSNLIDGTYIGTGFGYKNLLTVEVSIENGFIKSIGIKKTADDLERINKSRVVIDKIIETQSTDVDAVSTATGSSTGIIDAVKDALKSAQK